MWERCYKPGSVTRTSAGIQLSQSHKCQKIDFVQIITGSLTPDDGWTLTCGPGLIPVMAHQTPARSGVLTLDTHQMWCDWSVSGLHASDWLITLDTHQHSPVSSIVSKYWQSYRITFPGSWKSCVFLMLCLWVLSRRSWSAKFEFLGWATSIASVVIADQSNVVINFNDHADANRWPCDSDKNLLRNVQKLFKLFEKWGTRVLINTFGDLFSVIQVLGIWLG